MQSPAILWDQANNKFSALVFRTPANGNTVVYDGFTSNLANWQITSNIFTGATQRRPGNYMFYDVNRYVAAIGELYSAGQVWANQDPTAVFTQQVNTGSSPIIMSDGLMQVAFPQNVNVQYNSFYTSNDGAVWTQHNIASSGAGDLTTIDGYINGGTYTNGTYVIARYLGSGTSIKIAYSTDGLNWSQNTITRLYGNNETPVLRPVWYFNGYWYLVTNFGVYRSTTIGGTFSPHTPVGWTPSAGGVKDAYVWPARGMMIISDATPCALEYSYDGTNFSALSLPGPGVTGAVNINGTTDGSYWVAGLINGKIGYGT